MLGTIVPGQKRKLFSPQEVRKNLTLLDEDQKSFLH